MSGEPLGQARTTTRAGALLLFYVTLLGAGALGATGLFGVLGLVTVIAELGVVFWTPTVRDLLERVGIGVVYRGLARDVSAVLLLTATVELSPSQSVAVLLVPALVWVTAVVSGALAVVIDRRVPQTLTRNIDFGLHPRPVRPSAWVSRMVGDRQGLPGLVLVPGAFAAAASETLTPFFVAGGLAFALAAVGALILVVTLVRSLAVRRTRTRSALQTWLDIHHPQVAVYFGGPAKDVYQVDMWLGPVAALEQPAVIVLRDREAFATLASTRLPVICIPNAVEVMNLDFASVRVALYPANVGPNIHMLREPGMKHIFVGHGDSDKQASVNPYSKVYDEVWVAGRAARERYARAGVGVEDRDIVEVGRPQLAGVHRFASTTGGRPFTVLYAPTWEGWVDGDYNTSLVLMGESIVRGLLAVTPSVRVIYKPHPLTGTRRKDARAANARIIEIIRRAGGHTEASSLAGPAHRVVTGRAPGLFACFNEADLLISDVSSVVADYVQSERPYVVANPASLPEEEFRRTYPTAGAAYLLSADCGELEKFVEMARAGEDPMAQARHELKGYLLGPEDPTPLERFKAEVTRLCG